MLLGMAPTRSDALIRRFVDGDETVAGELVDHARLSADPAVLVAAAFAVPSCAALLGRAVAVAVSAAERRLVALAAAHLDGDLDRARLLARDHLADDPDNLLAAYVAAAARSEKRNP